MNLDSNPPSTNDPSSTPIRNHLNPRLVHNSNDINILNTDDHSKSSKSPPTKYYNHYYTATHSNHSNHGHPSTRTAHHSYSHSTPLAHTKPHNQRHPRSSTKRHSHTNGHPSTSAAAPSSSSSYHQPPSFIYKSHHTHSHHAHNHKPKTNKTAHKAVGHPPVPSQSQPPHTTHHPRHGQSQSFANQNHTMHHHSSSKRAPHDAEALSDSEILDLSTKESIHHTDDMPLTNGNRKQIQSTKATTLDHKEHSVTLSPLPMKDGNSHDTSETMDSSGSGGTSDEPIASSDEIQPAYPVKAIAFDLDKTMVRTISLHTNEQPQPEQHPNSYFMFFDEDTKEYHHVYKRPYLTQLLDFLSSEIVLKNRCKMMLCTHGTQKYAQTILQKCKADQLFPLMLPRKDWCRRKFEDDYKPRRFKTLQKMAQSVNERIEDIIMIDDDPGVYSKGDRCNGSLLHIKPFDDPYQQRNDNELNKLIKFLSGILKYGKNYYNKIFSSTIRYTGLVRSYMNAQEMAKHSLFRAQLMKRLVYDFNILMNKQERLGTMSLFDRYCATHAIDWHLVEKNKTHVAYYVILLFGCLFIARQYLYTDAKRPKQFRRDPYSAEIWLVHIDVYVQIVKKYKTLNGVSMYDPQSGSKHHHKHHHHHNHHHNHHKAHRHHHNNHVNSSEMQQQQQHSDHKKAQPSHAQHTIAMDDHQLITSYTSSNHAPPPPSANHHHHSSTSHAQQQHQMMNMQYHSHSHHRRKRKHKNREKQIYFTELHNITKQICGAVGYPKLLHGLYHRPEHGYDSSLFVKYEDYVESLFHHIEKTRAQSMVNNPFLKFD